jgi:hypothetical protein
MSPIVGPFTNALVLINSVDLSAQARGIHTVDSRAPVDVTAFGSSYTQETKGLGEASIAIDFLSDFSAGKVHATIQPLVGSTTPIAVEVRAVNAARSATNPAILLASALCFVYNALDATIGDAAMFTAEFRNAPGGAGITYPTA